MSILDRLFGKEEENPPARAYADRPPVQPAARTADEDAVERYRYMLRTAPPEQLEIAHEEAFAKLTPEQRKLALQQLSKELPDYEQPGSEDPRDLARAATRAEIRQPGTLNRAFGGGGGMGMGMGGMGMGSMLIGGLMTSMAGAFIGTAIANQFFDNPSHENGFQNDHSGDAATQETANTTPDPAGDPANESPSFNEDPAGDPGADTSYDSGLDAGGDMGDFGGDFGGDF